MDPRWRTSTPSASFGMRSRITRARQTHSCSTRRSGLFETRDMQNAVGLLLEQGARKFIQNHHEVVFEGR